MICGVSLKCLVFCSQFFFSWAAEWKGMGNFPQTPKEFQKKQSSNSKYSGYSGSQVYHKSFFCCLVYTKSSNYSDYRYVRHTQVLHHAALDSFLLHRPKKDHSNGLFSSFWLGHLALGQNYWVPKETIKKTYW